MSVQPGPEPMPNGPTGVVGDPPAGARCPTRTMAGSSRPMYAIPNELIDQVTNPARGSARVNAAPARMIIAPIRVAATRPGGSSDDSSAERPAEVRGVGADQAGPHEGEADEHDQDLRRLVAGGVEQCHDLDEGEERDDADEKRQPWLAEDDGREHDRREGGDDSRSEHSISLRTVGRDGRTRRPRRRGRPR